MCKRLLLHSTPGPVCYCHHPLGCQGRHMHNQCQRSVCPEGHVCDSAVRRRCELGPCARLQQSLNQTQGKIISRVQLQVNRCIRSYIFPLERAPVGVQWVRIAGILKALELLSRNKRCVEERYRLTVAGWGLPRHPVLKYSSGHRSRASNIASCKLSST